MFRPLISRREAIVSTAKFAGAAALGMFSLSGCAMQKRSSRKDFNVVDYGAVGDGLTVDSPAIQKAVDAAAASGVNARVLVPGGKKYVVGTIRLRGEMEFHLADDAELLASTRMDDFDEAAAVLTARDAVGLSITGTGNINGRSEEFMLRYDQENEWWLPKPFRPRLAFLTGCRELMVRDIGFTHAPSWTLHLLGCDGVHVTGVKIKNRLDVPNCDGIDPDHCRNVEISRCRIVCGDDAIVVKTSRRGGIYGGSSNILVRDCVIETQDCGLKIGTETTSDIRHVRFEDCEIISSGRGCTIQLRDEGDVSDVVFKNIVFKSRYHAAPWWGKGEGISFTALSRNAGSKLGRISGVRVENVTGRAENSVRISGCPESRIGDVVFDKVAVTLDRWTNYPGGMWDNRPTNVVPGIERHATPGMHIRYADNVLLRRCGVEWGGNCPDYFSHALEAHDVTGLVCPDFSGSSAHPEKLPAQSIL